MTAVSYPASDGTTANLADRIASILNDAGSHLPSSAEVLGSDPPLRAALSGIVIDHFTGPLSLGNAFSYLLEVALSDLRSPCWMQFPASLSEPSLSASDWNLAARMGHGHGLRGEIKQTDGGFRLSLRLFALDTGTTLATEHFPFVRPAEFSELTLRVLHWLFVALERPSNLADLERLSAQIPADPMDDYVKLVRLIRSNASDRAKLRACKAQSGRGLAAIEALYIDCLPARWMSHGALRALFEPIMRRFDGHAGLLGAWTDMVGEGVFSYTRAVIERVNALIVQRPDDPNLLMVSTQLHMLRGHHTGAMRLALDYVALYPRLALGWRQLGVLALSLGWKYRGTAYWNEIPEHRKRAFMGLSELAVECLERSLEINPDSVWTLVERMRAEGGCNDTLLDAFDRATTLDPHDRSAYEVAMNFTQPRWGGGDQVQFWVLSRAVKNNPGAHWPINLFWRYMARDPDYYLSARLKFIFDRIFNKNWPHSALDED